MKIMGLNVGLVRAATAVVAIASALAACGGGGGDGGSGSAANASVSAASVGPAKYAQRLLLTISGSNLDRGVTVAATGCRGVAPSTLPGQVSTATTAYYQCTVSAVGAGQFAVTRTSDGVALATAAFSVPTPQVTMTLSNGAGVSGTITVTLAPDKTPLTVDNFLAYVNAGFYDGTVIHRVSPGFVVQGGGYVAPVNTNTPTAKPTNAPIALEVNKGLSNTQWTIAMARKCDPALATSQFFINLADNSSALDPKPDPSLCLLNIDNAGFAVFGTVSGGTATVTSITTAPCVTIPLFLELGDCTPTPNVVVSSAVQTQ